MCGRLARGLTFGLDFFFLAGIAGLKIAGLKKEKG
jgi:hypothetical protein